MINIAGAADGRVAYLAAKELEKQRGQSLIVVSTQVRARRLATDLAFFHDEKPIYVMPEEDDGLVAFEASDSESLMEKMRILSAIASGQPCVVIAPVVSAIKKLPPPEIFAGSSRLKN